MENERAEIGSDGIPILHDLIDESAESPLFELPVEEAVQPADVLEELGLDPVVEAPAPFAVETEREMAASEPEPEADAADGGVDVDALEARLQQLVEQRVEGLRDEIRSHCESLRQEPPAPRQP